MDSHRASWVIEHLPDPVVVVTSDGTLEWANEVACEGFGLDPAEWMGRSVFDLLHPDDHAIAFAAFESVITKERGSLIDLRIRDGRGQWRQVEVRGAAVSDPLGDDRIVMIARDVADRQRLELGGGDNDRLRAMVHHATALLVDLDAEGCIRSANAELTRLLHHDVAVLWRRPFADIVDPTDRALVRDTLRAAGGGRLEVRLLRPDSSIVTVDCTITDLRDDPLVEGYTISATDVSGLKESQQALRQVADRDALTGLLSRRAMLQRLDDLVDDGFQHEIVVLFCDLDGFKQVNDRVGHAAGDQVLVEVARRLERGIRPGDLVGRLGGDEFVVVLPRADDSVRAEVEQRIRTLLTEPILAGDQEVRIGVSIGSATTGDHPTVTRLLATADDAMYAVKRAKV